jgi:Flp pilus assembly protein TadD
VAVLPALRLPLILLLVLLAAQSGLQTITWAHNGVFWRHTLDVNPKSALAHNNLGGVYMTAGGLPEAAAEFEAALRIQPDDPDALVNLGMVLLQLGRMQPAKDALQRGLRVRPGDPKAHLLLGMMALQAEDYFTALDHLQPAAAAEPQNLATRVSLAQALAGAGRTDDARTMLLDLLAQHPGYAPAEQALQRLK